MLLVIDDDRKAMGPPGRPKPALVLTYDDRHRLDVLVRKHPKHAQSLGLRRLIVLQCADGYDNRDVAEDLSVSARMVSKWRRRYLARGPEGLLDKPRAGVHRSITDDQEQALIAATLEESPPDGTRWTTRSMAEHLGRSQSSVTRSWAKFGLDPRRVNIFQLSADPQFVGKVRDVVGLYLNPPEGALVLCVDESANVGASDLRPPIVPPGPQTARHRSDDQHHGGTELHGALEGASGRVVADQEVAQLIERGRDPELRRFLGQIDRSVPGGLDLYVVVEHSSTKMTEGLRQWRLRHLRFEFDTAPTYGWWMLLVERWFAALANKGSGPSATELAVLINNWMERWNEGPRPFAWHKSADQIGERLSLQGG